MQDCKHIIALAQDNPHLYHRFKVALSQFLASANDRDQRYGQDPRNNDHNHDHAVMRVPARKPLKCGSLRISDNQNLSSLSKQPKTAKSGKLCTLCCSNVVEASEHRHGSGYPFNQAAPNTSLLQKDVTVAASVVQPEHGPTPPYVMASHVRRKR
jgi:hypothetical protein